jgi:hypothetical protein
VARIGDLGTIAVTSNWSTLLATANFVHSFFLPWWWRRWFLPNLLFLQESHGRTLKKTAFFIVTPWKPQILQYCVLFAKAGHWGLYIYEIWSHWNYEYRHYCLVACCVA